MECPGCGLTRSFIRLGHGQWRSAWNHHPVGCLAFVMVFANLLLRMMELRQLRNGRRWQFARCESIAWKLLAVATLLQWIAKLSGLV